MALRRTVVLISMFLLASPAFAYRIFDASLAPCSGEACAAVDPGEASLTTRPFRLLQTTITYYIDRDSIPSNLTLEQVQAAVRDAAKGWQAIKGLAAPIRFVETPVVPANLFDDYDSTVVIVWKDSCGLGDGSAITCTAYDVATALWRPGSTIYISPSIAWTTSRREWLSGGRHYLTGVVAHEFGHVLGLAHSGNIKATMYASANASVLIGATSVFPDDREGIAYLYAENRAPVVASITAVNEVLNPGETTAITVVATDPEGDPIKYFWKKSGGTFQGCAPNTASCTWKAPLTAGSYVISARVRDSMHNWHVLAETRITVAGPTQTLIATLDAVPSSGVAPLSVDLTAGLAGTATGKSNYTYYCDRADAQTTYGPGWATRVLNTRDTTHTESRVCRYTAPGTYSAKIVTTKGSALPTEARTLIHVTLCTPNAAQPCYTGPQGTAGVGACSEGTQTCSADGMSFGPCEGETTPQPENCSNSIDDDCNELVDMADPGCDTPALLADNFDSYTDGSFPSGGGWVQYTDTVQVDGTLSVSPSNSLGCFGTLGLGAFAYRNITVPGGTSTVAAEAWVRPSRNDSVNMTIRLGSDCGGGPGVAFRTNGEIHGTEAVSGSTLLSGTYTANTWVKVRIALDLGTRTYSVSLNDTNVGSLQAQPGGAPSVICIGSDNNLSGGTGGGTTVHFDDIRVEAIP